MPYKDKEKSSSVTCLALFSIFFINLCKQGKEELKRRKTTAYHCCGWGYFSVFYRVFWANSLFQLDANLIYFPYCETLLNFSTVHKTCSVFHSTYPVYTRTNQCSLLIVGDDGFEPGTAGSALCSTFNKPEHLQKRILGIFLVKQKVIMFISAVWKNALLGSSQSVTSREFS